MDEKNKIINKNKILKLCNKYDKILIGKAFNYNSNRTNEYKEFKNNLIKITNFLDSGKTPIKLSERVFCLLNNIDNIDKIPKCRFCKINIVQFMNYKIGYNENNSCFLKKCKLSFERLGYNSNNFKNPSKKFIKKLCLLHNSRTLSLSKKTEDVLFKDFLIKKTQFLDRDKTSFKNYHKIGLLERIYCVFNNIKKSPICKICNKHKIPFSVKLKKYDLNSTCGSEECKLIKRKLTTKKKFGVENVYQSKVIKEKIKKSNLLKFGCENPQQSKKIKTKTELTNLKRYGFKNVSSNQVIKNKIKETISKRTKEQKKLIGFKIANHPNSIKNQFGSETFKENMIKLYGMSHVSQVAEFHEKQQKSAHKFKHYKINKSGTILLLQGYEPKVIDNLLNTYKESEIIVDRNKIPKFMYKTKDNKNHRYIPDIYIPKENLIIEVKSEWTKTLKPEIQELKKKSILKNKFKFKLIVPKNNKELENISLIKTL